MSSNKVQLEDNFPNHQPNVSRADEVSNVSHPSNASKATFKEALSGYSGI